MQELELERKKAMADIQLQQQKLEADIALKREKIMADLEKEKIKNEEQIIMNESRASSDPLVQEYVDLFNATIEETK